LSSDFSLVETGFSDNRIEPDVPGTRLDPVETLTFVRHTNQPRPAPTRVTPPQGQGAIIETAAHAESVPLGVEPDQRQDDQIETSHPDQMPAPPSWFGNTEAIGSQPLACTITCKPECALARTAFERMQNRKIETRTPGREGRHQPARVDLAIGGPVERDLPRTLHTQKPNQSTHQRLGLLAFRTLTQCTACR
jgi:hypothetical protein